MNRLFTFVLGAMIAFPLCGQTQKPFQPWEKRVRGIENATSNIPEVVVFEEHFNAFTAGSEENPDSENLGGSGATQWLMKEGYTVQPKWFGDNIYQAGGVCALKEYERSYNGSSYKDYGFIGTPETELYGEIVVTCRARKMTAASDETYLFLVLADNGQGLEDSNEYPLTNEWKTIEFRSDKASFGKRETIQFQAKEGGVLIDDIKVVRKRMTIPTPIVNPAVNTSKTSFKASWQPIPGITDFLLNVYYKDWPDNPIPEGVITEGFDAINVDANGKIDQNTPGYPEGWTIDLSTKGTVDMATKTGDYKSGKQALFFDEEGDYVVSPETPAPIKEISFWIKPTSMMKPSSYLWTLLQVAVKRGDKWEIIANLYNGFLQKDGGVYSFKGDALGEGVTQLKLTFFQKGDPIEFCVDDINLVYESQKVPRPFLEGKLVKGTEFEVTGIDPEKEYIYNVVSKDGELLSQASETVWVDGIVGTRPSALSSAAVTGNSFTAQWDKYHHAECYNVNLYRYITTQKADEWVTLVEENFNKITEGTLEAPEKPTHYTPRLALARVGKATTDWIATFPIWANGMMGADKRGEYQMDASLLCSPGMELSGAKGISIEATVYPLAASDIIWVLLMKNPTDKEALMGYEFTTSSTPREKFDIKAVFAAEHLEKVVQPGEKYYIAFSSQNGNAFLFDNVKISRQCYKAGEEVKQYKSYTFPTTNSIEFTGLEDGGTYAFDVQAYRMKDFKEFISLVSEEARVQLVTSIERMEQEEGISAKGMMGYVELEVGELSDVAVYNMQGEMLYKASLQAGVHKVELAPAAYLVTIGEVVTKVLVR